MEKEVVLTRNAPAPPAHYSQAIKAKGFVFISGQLGRNPSKGEIVDFTIEGQTRHILESIKRIVAVAGGSLDDVVRIVIYLVNMEHYPIVHRLRMEYFGDEPPASTCVQVARLYDTRQLIEIEATAIIPHQKHED